MTASTPTSVRSRRALLAGALGGLGVLVAGAAARLEPTAAAAGDPIRMGRLNKASGTSTTVQTSTSKPAFRAVQLGGGNAIRAEATTGRAVMAVAGSGGTGVWASSPDHYAVHAECPNGTGVLATSGNETAIVASGARVGVEAFGSEAGIRASGTQRAGEFWGHIFLSGHQDMVPQVAEPPAPLGATVRLFVRDNGSGKSQLCVRFSTGAVQVLATQP